MTTFTSWDESLCHHGIRGQKWGIRKYQNEDGSLTAAGQARYGENGTATAKQQARFLNRLDRQRAYNAVRVAEVSKSNSKRSNEKKAAYSKMEAATNKTIKSVLTASKRKNMSISSKEVTRHVETGRTRAKSIAKSIGLSALVTAGVGAGSVAAAAHAARIAGASYVSVHFPFLAVGVVSTRKTKGTKYKAAD